MKLGSLLISRNFLYSLLSADRGSYHIIFITRFIRNSGFVISGCCFSRQSDGKRLLPKFNQDISNSLIVNNSQPQLTIVQHVKNCFKMKRNYKSLNDVSSQHLSVDTEQFQETHSKKQKPDIYHVTSIDEVTENSKISPGHSINNILDLPKSESVTTEVNKSYSNAEKPKKQRPNYFVAIQISNTEIMKTLNKLQQHMLDRDQRLRKSMIELSTLHITLMVMHIEDAETHARALKALENIHQEHDDDLSKNPLKLEFKGLGHFQNRVLYAKLIVDDSFNRLNSLVKSVEKHYNVAGISSTDSKTDFTPHLTVAKIRMYKHKQLPKKINPSLYKDFNDCHFGSQEIQGIQLLSMMDPLDEFGYYSGKNIYFSAFDPKIRRDYLSKMLQTEEKKKNVKESISALMKEKL